ncbi:MAG: hypothetical protein GY853_00325 [PVC group bacterium]|nr:hypothetical protein [PVC group bacterium]
MSSRFGVIFKIIVIVLVQAFLTLDLAWAAQGNLRSFQADDTISPYIQVENISLQAGFSVLFTKVAVKDIAQIETIESIEQNTTNSSILSQIRNWMERFFLKITFSLGQILLGWTGLVWAQEHIEEYNGPYFDNVWSYWWYRTCNFFTNPVVFKTVLVISGVAMVFLVASFVVANLMTSKKDRSNLGMVILIGLIGYLVLSSDIGNKVQDFFFPDVMPDMKTSTQKSIMEHKLGLPGVGIQTNAVHSEVIQEFTSKGKTRKNVIINGKIVGDNIPQKSFTLDQNEIVLAVLFMLAGIFLIDHAINKNKRGQKTLIDISFAFWGPIIEEIIEILKASSQSAGQLVTINESDIADLPSETETVLDQSGVFFSDKNSAQGELQLYMEQFGALLYPTNWDDFRKAEQVHRNRLNNCSTSYVLLEQAV